jgi:hypothetical protein
VGTDPGSASLELIFLLPLTFDIILKLYSWRVHLLVSLTHQPTLVNS